MLKSVSGGAYSYLYIPNERVYAPMTKEEEMEPMEPTRIVVTDIRMPLWSMVIFMVKWAIAAIPALIILATIWIVLVTLFGGMGMMFGGRL